MNKGSSRGALLSKRREKCITTAVGGVMMGSMRTFLLIYKLGFGKSRIVVADGKEKSYDK
jgi:hypothetical protein